jgi:hypothetical protein
LDQNFPSATTANPKKVLPKKVSMTKKNMDGKEGVVVRAGQWFLRRKHLSEEQFRNQFGVYPKTVVWVMEHLGIIREKWLLRSLWWLKEYPTEEQIKNYNVGPKALKDQMWPLLRLMESGLPEVKFNFFFFFFF